MEAFEETLDNHAIYYLGHYNLKVANTQRSNTKICSFLSLLIFFLVSLPFPSEFPFPIPQLSFLFPFVIRKALLI
jgi:hypothetical protein